MRTPADPLGRSSGQQVGIEVTPMVGDASELTPGDTTFGFSSQVLVSDLAAPA